MGTAMADVRPGGHRARGRRQAAPRVPDRTRTA